MRTEETDQHRLTHVKISDGLCYMTHQINIYVAEISYHCTCHIPEVMLKCMSDHDMDDTAICNTWQKKLLPFDARIRLEPQWIIN